VNPIKIIWNFLGRTYHRLASPREFYTISRYVTPIFGFLFLGLTSVGAYYGLFVAPADYQQGESYRIIFVHVPSAWLSMFIYVTMAIAAAIGLIWRMKMAFVVAICSAPIGAAFTALALITGSIWGKPIWGTWWVWDQQKKRWRYYLLLALLLCQSFITQLNGGVAYTKAQRSLEMVALRCHQVC